MENYLFKEYPSPFGKIYLESDGKSLTGLWFETQREEWNLPKSEPVHKVFQQTEMWLDEYFQGKCPEVSLDINLRGTPFQVQVWNILLTIPYGQTMTYGEIAGMIAESRHMKRMSAQAVGQAVGHNPVSVIVPCHRVVGTDQSLTGYAGGLSIKRELLKLEGIRLTKDGNKIETAD